MLGDFTDCDDESHQVLKPPATDEERATIRADRAAAPRVPLRRTYDQREAFDVIFGEVGKRLGIPDRDGLARRSRAELRAVAARRDYEIRPDGALRWSNGLVERRGCDAARG